MTMKLHDLKGELEMVTREINELLERREGLEYAITSIDQDLNNSLQEFVATTRRDPADYYPWRTRAKKARKAKANAYQRAGELLANAKVREMRLQMLIYARESNYRGENPSELLRAAYHLLMHVIDTTGITLDESQMGLVATIRLQSGYGVPKGSDS